MTPYNSTAALVLLLAVYVLRKAPGIAPLWQRIPEGWRWTVPTLAGVLAGVVPVVAQHGNLHAVLVALVSGLVGISLPAMGAHALVKDSPLPVDGGSGGKT